MVRLKVGKLQAWLDGRTCFNSIVVRLKGGLGVALSTTGASFQFHSGSIKSVLYCAQRKILAGWFQFHSGSIKRWTLWQRRKNTRRFQFHSGSIKSDEENESAICLLEFQFHSGSIKRRPSVARKI